MKAKRGTRRKAAKKSKPRDLSTLERSARRVKGGVRATPGRSKRV